MEEIFVDAAVAAEDIKENLSALFPGLKPFQCSLHKGEFESGFSFDVPSHILFEIEHEPKRLDFHWRLSIYRTPNKDYEKRQIVIAKQLANKLMRRVAVNYTLPEMPDYPYGILIFDKENCYLSDDAMFDWTGESERASEPIEIVRQIDHPEIEFDDFGRLLQQKAPDL